ncbi:MULTISPECIES: GntR family transcriptional regulator [unclassified Pseudomonas]|uniref:GntR family transcriptional regulator n=1 Tax=unclassified Pseudomonas TaxID=196821 RepID=UPI000BD0B998|nr:MULTISPECIES: GntR family transcriptional regulator [unclassified Pseudomonas]PVZ19865.1 GntR family transcriptional regulator [Pseudomonas sp. URIL14HWK12:I12]PVZ26931.1 GntR family transcriptional regulator [Pseudomonas sp. URIL14HWK12:I10]PVZ37820.1 GntR family transcriptional regulator [Pseudomonas sp. URIL14HWK12:I11]SNZ05538.1 transcriptional regulator, GntR family [Pseudomonas sp. URIL14HWK12:I9]
MPALSSDERLPLYQRLRDELAGHISGNRWKAGEAIPTEAVLAADYQLSIGTVRKAIDMLVSERILERQQGRGTFIRRAQFHDSLFRFFRFQTTEGERRLPESQVLAVNVLPAPSDAAKALQLAEGDPVIHLSRLRLIDAQPLLAEDIWLPKTLFEAILDKDLNQEGPLLYPLYEEFCGQVIASADETLTAEPADEHSASLLGIAMHSPVVLIERLARGYAGQPLEWRRSRGHAQHFRYSVEIR